MESGEYWQSERTKEIERKKKRYQEQDEKMKEKKSRKR